MSATREGGFGLGAAYLCGAILVHDTRFYLLRKLMNRIRTYSLVLAAVLSATPLRPQAPIEGANVYGDLSYSRTSLIFESRRLAYQELAAPAARFETPNIATALTFPSYLIAIARINAVQIPIARITAVQQANGSSLPRTRISFHVERFLRGESDVTDFVVESKWVPSFSPTDPDVIDTGFNRGTVLDRSQPKKGDRYILGYSLDYGDRKTVFVPSAIDMQDPSQALLINDVEQFLSIESAADGSGFEPYLDALDSSIPWIREIMIQRLTSSEACNASPVCTQRFSAVVRRQLQSKIPNERLEAGNWIVWIDSVSRAESLRKGWPDGLPVLTDSAIRQLLNSAIDDSNVYIGDQAFERREMFDFNRRASAGECIQVVPALRKSAHWLPGDHDYSGQNELLPVGFPLSSSTSCIPVQKSPDKQESSAPALP